MEVKFDVQFLLRYSFDYFFLLFFIIAVVNGNTFYSIVK
jgi:hypothetical protein